MKKIEASVPAGGEANNEEFDEQEEVGEADKTMDKTQDERTEVVVSPLRTPEGKKEQDEDELTEDDDITLESS